MRQVYFVKELYEGRSTKQDYAVYVADGQVTVVQPASLPAPEGEWQAVRYPNHLMLPAFIDAHDHGRGISPAAMGAPDMPLELWIPQLGKVCTPVAAAALYDALLLVSSGVTTAFHCHNCGDISQMRQELIDVAAAYLKAGVRVVLCPPYIDQNCLIYHEREDFARSLPASLAKEFAGMVNDVILPLDQYFELVKDLRETLAPQIAAGEVDIQLHPVAAQWCSDDALLAMRDFAEEHDMRVHMHLLETQHHAIYARKRFGKTAVRHLADIGFLSPRLSCAHTVWLTQDDMDLLRENGVACVLNHSSNLRLKSGQPKLHQMLDSGLVCGLGLDGCALDDDQDYLREMRLAHHNATATGMAARITALDVMDMATKNGAAIAGGHLSPGCIRPGSRADFVLLDLERMCFPYGSEEEGGVETALRCGTRQSVAAVYQEGRQVAKDGKPLCVSLDDAGLALREGVLAARQHAGAGPSSAILEKIREFYTAWEAKQ